MCVILSISEIFALNSSKVFFVNSEKSVDGTTEHNRLNVRRIALGRLVGPLINCNLLQSGGEPKWD